MWFSPILDKTRCCEEVNTSSPVTAHVEKRRINCFKISNKGLVTQWEFLKLDFDIKFGPDFYFTIIISIQFLILSY